jgi:hypothetical protein
MTLLKETNGFFVHGTAVNVKVNSSRNFLSYETRKLIKVFRWVHTDPAESCTDFHFRFCVV